MFTSNDIDGTVLPKKKKPKQQKNSKKKKKTINFYGSCCGRMYTPEKAAHVVVFKDEKTDNFNYYQYKMEKGERYRPLVLKTNKETVLDLDKQSELLSTTKPTLQDEMTGLLAYTPNGTQMISNRSYVIQDGNGNLCKVLLFSPNKEKSLLDNEIHKERKRKQEANNIGDTEGTKHHTEKTKKRLKFDNILPEENKKTEENLPSRSPSPEKEKEFILYGYQAKKKRGESGIPSQNKVMKKTAKQEVIDFIGKNENKDNLTAMNMLKSLVEKDYALEWLHALAFSLSPKDFNPQTPKNLGAGPKWINTLMITLERLAAYFAKQYPGAVTVKPLFEKIPESHIIEKISYEVTIQMGEEIRTISSSIKVLELPNSTNCASSTDFSQLKTVLQGMLTNATPTLISKRKT